MNTASIGGRLAGWTGTDYSAAKAAVIQLTRSAAIELGQRGIR
ncbi:MAG: SDR family oxidoreductase, partial [Streptosporangiaceae bacterium]